MHTSQNEARIGIQLQQTTLPYFLFHGSLNSIAKRSYKLEDKRIIDAEMGGGNYSILLFYSDYFLKL